MSASAGFMAALGIGASFMPQEILASHGAQPGVLAVLLVQTAGGLYLGFAILNWTSRGNRIGGIYGRPIALGNLLHFAAVAITLLKALAGGLRAGEVMGFGAAYTLFALWFAWVLFSDPLPPGSPAVNQTGRLTPPAADQTK